MVKMRIGVHENGNTQEWEYVRMGMGVRENEILGLTEHSISLFFPLPSPSLLYSAGWEVQSKH